MKGLLLKVYKLDSQSHKEGLASSVTQMIMHEDKTRLGFMHNYFTGDEMIV